MGMKKTATFITGALVGIGLGFLFAPKSGSDTRKELSKKMSDLWDKIRAMDANEIKENLEKKLKELETEIKELDKEKVLKYAKEKAVLLKNKSEDLLEKAKEAGKPVVENAVKEVKKELAAVTKEVLNKLESEEK